MKEKRWKWLKFYQWLEVVNQYLAQRHHHDKNKKFKIFKKK